MQKEETDAERAVLVGDLSRQIAQGIETAVSDLVRPPVEVQVDESGADVRRRCQHDIGSLRRDDLDLAGEAECRLARDPDVRFGEGQECAEAIVVPALVAGPALESRQRLDGEVRFSSRELRLSELEHQRDLDTRAFIGWQMRRVRDGAVQERTGLARRIPPERVAGGDPEIPGRAQVIARAVEMARQVRRCLVLAPGEHTLHRQPGALVRRRARCRRHVIDHDLLIEPVREAIERAEDAVGELHHSFAHDERPSTGEHLEHRFQCELVHVRRVRRQPERKRDADDARGIDGLPFVGRQFIELSRDGADEAGGDRRFERIGRHFETPSLAVVDDISVAYQIFDRCDEKEWIAARQVVQAG